MGEWKIQVAVKFESSTVERFDRDIQRFAPFCEGRSAIARVLVDVAYAAIDAGIIPWSLESIQEILSVSRRQVIPGIPGVPVLPKRARGRP